MRYKEQEDGTLVLLVHNKMNIRWMDEHFKRIPGEFRWLKKQSLGAKGKSFVTSMISGQADEELFNARLKICLQCKGLKREKEKKIYCGLCGCPKSPASELHFKLRRRQVTCPLGHFN